ncbi:11139_t:CDS:2, partial [Scutellospora calospora]
MEITDIINFAVGVLVSIGASIMDAAGINLLKLDHVKNSSKPIQDQRNDCGRPLWHAGLYCYILSQVFGSTIALNFLQPQWVAPLGSVSLIFNFIFARVLVGTKITKQDLWGTLVIVISVIWVVGFGGINQQNNGSGIEISRLQNWVGMTMAGVGGLLASQTLLLAKSGVKLVSSSISEHESQFTDKLSWFILLFLMFTAIFQVFCLNTALKLLDTVLVVPMFYGFYTTMGLVNTMIYLDELSEYPAWALCLIAVGIAALVYDSKGSKKHKKKPSESEDVFANFDQWLASWRKWFASWRTRFSRNKNVD